MSEDSNVIDLPVITTVDLPAHKILNGALQADLETVVVIGWSKDGELYFASTTADGAEVVWLFEVGKKELLG